MAALSYLKAGEYPPDDRDFVLISIAMNGWVRVTARFGATDLRSEHFRESDPEMALHRATERARLWAEEGSVALIYVEGGPAVDN